MLSIRECIKGRYVIIYPARKYVKCWRGCRWGGMHSIWECVKGRYVIIPRTQICIVLEEMQDEDVCLAFGNVERGGTLSHPAHNYVWCWRRCKIGMHA